MFPTSNAFPATAVHVAKSICIRIPVPPPSDSVEVEVDGERLRAKHLKMRIRRGGREYVYHYLCFGLNRDALQLLGKKLEVRMLSPAAPAKAVTSTAELPALPRQYLMLPCAEKIMKLLELAGGCIDVRMSDVGLAVMCATSTIKATLKKLKEEGKIAEDGWMICLR